MALSLRTQRKMIRLINEGVWKPEDGPIFSTRQVVIGPDQMAWEFYCDHCGGMHQHSPDGGHRRPHCHDADSPWHETGYTLKTPSKWGMVDDLILQNTHEAAFWIDWYTETRPRLVKEPQMIDRVSPVQFYKDGDTMGVRTTLSDPDAFLKEAAERLGTMIDDGLFTGDWSFQLSWWLPQIVEVACKLKGYKADVREERLITAGHFDPPKDSLIRPELAAVTTE